MQHHESLGPVVETVLNILAGADHLRPEGDRRVDVAGVEGLLSLDSQRSCLGAGRPCHAQQGGEQQQGEQWPAA